MPVATPIRWYSCRSGYSFFAKRLDVEGIDFGVRLDDGVHELFRIAVVGRGIEDDGSHKKAFQL